MKLLFLMIFILIFVIGSANLGDGLNDNPKKADNVNRIVKAKNIKLSEGNLNANKLSVAGLLNKCTNILKEVSVKNPIKICNEIRLGKEKCIEILNKEGVTDSASICSTFENSLVEAKGLLKEVNRERIGELIKLNKPEVKRKLKTSELKELRNELKVAKENIFNQKNKFNEKKDLFKRLRNCKNSNSDECNNLREGGLEFAINYLKDGLGLALNHLKIQRSRIEISEDLDENQVKELLNSIDESEIKLKEFLTKIDSINNKNELKELVKEIRPVIADLRVKEKSNISKLMHGRLNHLFKQVESINLKLKESLTEFEKVGINLDEYGIKINEIKDKLIDIENNINQAKDLLDDTGNSDKARDLLKSIQKELREVHKKVLDLITEFKDLNKGDNDEI